MCSPLELMTKINTIRLKIGYLLLKFYLGNSTFLCDSYEAHQNYFKNFKNHLLPTT